MPSAPSQTTLLDLTVEKDVNDGMLVVASSSLAGHSNNDVLQALTFSPRGAEVCSAVAIVDGDSNSGFQLSALVSNATNLEILDKTKLAAQVYTLTIRGTYPNTFVDQFVQVTFSA